MRITLRQLAHAMSLMRHGSFREAAAELHLTQPALTRSIQALESGLGVALFDRLASGVEVTRAGESLLRQAEVILMHSREMERDARLIAGLESGSIRVFTAAYPGHELAPRAIATCMQQTDGFSCTLINGDWRDAVHSVISREVDVAVADISLIEDDERFELIRLEPARLHFVCRPEHPLAARRELALSDVCAFPLTSCLATPNAGALFNGFPRAGAVDPETGDFHPAIEVKSLDAAIRIAMRSDAITAAQLCSIEQQLADKSLVVLRVPALPLRLCMGLIHLRDRALAPMATLFRDVVVATGRDLAARDHVLREQYGLDSGDAAGT